MSIDYLEALKYFKAATDQYDDMGELNYDFWLFEGHGIWRDQTKKHLSFLNDEQIKTMRQLK
jgi:hypothetical protein